MGASPTTSGGCRDSKQPNTAKMGRGEHGARNIHGRGGVLSWPAQKNSFGLEEHFSLADVLRAPQKVRG